MTIEVKLPDLGDGIESGDVLEIFVAVGDTIDKGQDIVEMETDKATVTVPASAGGKVTKILISEGDTVAINGAILELDADAAGVDAATSPAPETAAAPEPAPSPEPDPPPAAPAPAAETPPVTPQPVSPQPTPVAAAPTTPVVAAHKPQLLPHRHPQLRSQRVNPLTQIKSSPLDLQFDDLQGKLVSTSVVSLDRAMEAVSLAMTFCPSCELQIKAQPRHPHHHQQPNQQLRHHPPDQKPHRPTNRLPTVQMSMAQSGSREWIAFVKRLQIKCMRAGQRFQESQTSTTRTSLTWSIYAKAAKKTTLLKA